MDKDKIDPKDPRVFDYDPVIGCPFDRSEMEMVENCGDLKLGGRVSFLGQEVGEKKPILKGTLMAIGKNAKYLNGDTFTAILVKVGSRLYPLTASDLLPLV